MTKKIKNPVKHIKVDINRLKSILKENEEKRQKIENDVKSGNTLDEEQERLLSVDEFYKLVQEQNN